MEWVRLIHLSAAHVASFGDHVKLGVYDSATEKEVSVAQ